MVKIFDIYPAIDLQSGRAVQLRRGVAEDAMHCGDALDIAAGFAHDGAQYLHIVDLDGAFSGAGANGELISKIVKSVSMKVQTGGGIRTMQDIEKRLEDWGVWRVILGTVAVENPALLAQAAKKYPGRIALGLDARNGLVATRGWVEQTALPALDLAQKAAQTGVSAVIYTDITRDGMLAGPNLEQTRHMAEHAGLAVIASGGISQLCDIENIMKTGAAGCIIGSALYTGRFTLKEALGCAASQAPLVKELSPAGD
ncbi:MAG: 1-(5-phosphoribosyl)-5-[(5-phosphoribosylamino)methylideneamino]imidazole-4-carboxamide isomerase [Clostridia bacterium]|nr:1-(5-phosphoribosyl)-5-[(5-phosphoribosylamino)methylideneamino]imidazole-4-carboxamide isomerase [Clostridia bacterium]